MLIILSIYILGILAYLVTLVIGYHKLESEATITLSELLVHILLGFFSWLAFLAGILTIYGDTTILKKK